MCWSSNRMVSLVIQLAAVSRFEIDNSIKRIDLTHSCFNIKDCFFLCADNEVFTRLKNESTDLQWALFDKWSELHSYIGEQFLWKNF